MAWLGRGERDTKKGQCQMEMWGVRSAGLTPHPLPSPDTHLLPCFSACCHQGGILVADKGVGVGRGDKKMDRDTQMESQRQRRERV